MQRSRSSHSDSGLDGIEQGIVAERLEQTRYRSGLQEARLEGPVPLRGDEYDGDALAPAYEFLLQLRAAHTRQPDIEDQAACEVDGIGVEERFRRCEHLNSKSDLPQEVGQ
jgi:hypothetical protein